MKLKNISILVCTFIFFCGIGFYWYESSTYPLLYVSPEKWNRRTSQSNYKGWGKYFDFENLESNSPREEPILYIWNTSFLERRTNFLEIKLHNNKTIDAKFCSYKGFPDRGKLLRKSKFKVEPNDAAVIFQEVRNSKFFESRDRGPDEQKTDGDRWFVEGKKGTKLVRWESLIGDKSSIDAQILGSKIYHILTISEIIE